MGRISLLVFLVGTTIESKKCYRKGIGVLEENGLDSIKKELKIKGLVKGNRGAGLLKGSTTSV